MKPVGPPEFFIDRSLGRHQLADALRAAGVTVHTMAEVYGEQVGQGLTDETWLAEASDCGWVLLFKDKRIRYRKAQLEAIVSREGRAFCLANGNVTGDEIVAWHLANLPEILRRATTEPGPFVYGVYATQLRRIWPSR